VIAFFVFDCVVGFFRFELEQVDFGIHGNFPRKLEEFPTGNFKGISSEIPFNFLASEKIHS
jgi:hypothetical protein